MSMDIMEEARRKAEEMGEELLARLYQENKRKLEDQYLAIIRMLEEKYEALVEEFVRRLS
ncbi:MAG: hypothetical protein G5Z42_01365 [Caldisphaeraceae archaeon]|nr:hypothetical protein [Caldisphaeraceae archaeon]MEB3797453.1 hypothetical protein [Caldisphaeraceae archaeon]